MLSKLIKHSAKHQDGEINDNTPDSPVLTFAVINEHSKVHEKDKTVTEDTQENNQGQADHTKAKRKLKEKSDFVDGEPWTCQICGFKSDKVSELARHVDEPCKPAWLNDFLNSSFVQKN